MRLNASKFGLFASLLGAVAGQETTTEYAAGGNPDTSVSSGSYITFETLAQQNIFRPQEGDAQIKWVANVDSRLEVKEVRLHKQYKTGDNDTVIGSGEVEALADTSATNGKRVTNLTIASEPTSYNQVWNDKILYLEVVSENKTSTARSYSPGFIVLGAEASAAVEGAARDILDNWSAKPSDTIEGAAATTTAADPTSTSTPTSTSQTSADADASLAENGGGGGGGGGLSPGAIAGIAVGVAVGALAIAGVLAWFFCFRRRRRSAAASSAGFSRAHEGPYGAGSGAAVMMTEKEAAGLAESRDRPSLTQDRGINGGAAAGTSRAYAPYSDDNEHHIPGMAVTTTGTDSQASLPLQPPHYQHSRNRSAATASPSPIESRYAHLIEEGMTEDEIRRLEEEERQLDAAIEEAGSGSNNNNGGSGGKR
ncbi:hypothetical protein UCREL1_1010 [Eutypa lata UCREL1]|uniref:Uncharacterized protein n=1 Tax=Eutypa lata (strain UCR-EL1) TaxID=1287681 RepID=M7TPV6_EUTLA|nr:hypothetical protein UCREL1_1010 [Eutypa lata UCREL1]